MINIEILKRVAPFISPVPSSINHFRGRAFLIFFGIFIIENQKFK